MFTDGIDQIDYSQHKNHHQQIVADLLMTPKYVQPRKNKRDDASPEIFLAIAENNSSDNRCHRGHHKAFIHMSGMNTDQIERRERISDRPDDT